MADNSTKVRMVNRDVTNDKFGEVEYFSTLVAESEACLKQGWVREDLSDLEFGGEIRKADAEVKTEAERFFSEGFITVQEGAPAYPAVAESETAPDVQAPAPKPKSTTKPKKKASTKKNKK